MTKQEDIREGIAEKIFEWCKRNGYASFRWNELTGATRGLILAITDIVLEYEDSQGAVIKVDREPPAVSWTLSGQDSSWQAEKIGHAFREAYKDYVLVEPLI